MYKKLPECDPDLLPGKTTDNKYHYAIPIVLIILAAVSVIGVYFFVMEESITKKFSSFKNSTNVNFINKSPIRIIEHDNRLSRIIIDEPYFKMYDCSETDDFYVEYFDIRPLPINIHNNLTFNTRMIMKEGFHWSTEVQFDLEKWFFGIPFLSLRLPCFMKYFGSCRFNFCDMLRAHWDEQFCLYLHNHYDMNCLCQDLLGPGVFEFKNFHYKPVLDKVFKYFSWIASGWFDMKIRLYKKKYSTRPYLCTHMHFEIETKHPQNKWPKIQD